MPNLLANHAAAGASGSCSASVERSCCPKKLLHAVRRTRITLFRGASLATGLAAACIFIMPPVGQALALGAPVDPHQAPALRVPTSGKHTGSTLSFTQERSGVVAVSGGRGQWMHWNIANVTVGRLTPRSPDQPGATTKTVDNRREAFKAWYASKASGVEQSFTLNHPPGGLGRAVVITMASTGNLVPVLDSPQKVVLQGPIDAPHLVYSHLKVTDALGRVLRSRLALAGGAVTISFDDPRASYPVVVDPLIQLAGPSATSGSNAFGSSISSSANGETLLVGDPQGGAAGGGQATVYTYSGSTWSNGSALTPPAGSVSFGASVALSPDGGTALVGDPNCYDLATETGGSVTAYTFDGTGWSSGTELTPPSEALDFGTSLATTATAALVGDAEGGSAGTGSAIVYTYNGTSWSSGAQLSPPSTSATFGTAVSLSSGGTTAVVGDPTASGGGSATAYTNSGSWSSGRPLTLPANPSHFGYSVDVAGNLAIVGDPEGGSTATGTATIYSYNGTSWSSGTPLAPPAVATAFGTSVALSPDGSTALVGDPKAQGGGMATEYLDAGSWSSAGALALPSNAEDFGNSTSLSTDGSFAYVGDPDGGACCGVISAYTDVASSTTVVSINPTSTSSGSTVTYSATVTSAGGTPTGSVAFKTGTTTLCTVSSLTSGSGSCTASNAPTGTDSVTGTYSGSTNFAGSSGTASLSVVPASSTTVVSINPTSTSSGTTVTSGQGPTFGYDLVSSNGGVFVFPTGQSGGFFGSLLGRGVTANDVVGIVPTNDFTGYDLVGSDGGVFVFPGGSFGFYGSLPGIGLHVHNIVGIVPTTNGYDLVGSDGGVFVFPTGQSEGYYGSLPAMSVHLNNIVGIVATPGGGGYFLVGRDGGVFTFGSAPFFGSLPSVGIHVNDITGIASAPDGKGYYVVGADGSVYAFGDAEFFGSLPQLGVQVSNIVSIVPTPDGGGYWLIGSDGGVFSFGDAPDEGSLPSVHTRVNNIVGAVPTG